MAVYVVMTLGSFFVVLRMRDEAGRPRRDDLLAFGPVALASAARGGDGDVHVQLGRAFRR
jgi:hypothetical protein